MCTFSSSTHFTHTHTHTHTCACTYNPYTYCDHFMYRTHNVYLCTHIRPCILSTGTNRILYKHFFCSTKHTCAYGTHWWNIDLQEWDPFYRKMVNSSTYIESTEVGDKILALYPWPQYLLEGIKELRLNRMRGKTLLGKAGMLWYFLLALSQSRKWGGCRVLPSHLTPSEDYLESLVFAPEICGNTQGWCLPSI